MRAGRDASARSKVSSPTRLAIFGSTGSIGRQALEVVSHFPGRLEVICLTAGESVGLLAQQCRTHHPQFAVVASAGAAEELGRALDGTTTQILVGPQGLLDAAAVADYDVALMAISGVAALQPTLEILKQRRRLALANKESLVAGGHLVMKEVEMSLPTLGEKGSPPTAKNGKQASLVPVDSEHSAIYQLLQRVEREEVAGITLTASGGPFLNATREELELITPQMALRHPTWQMGPKVTVDSATLMNKGLEVIEAQWLFALLPSQIRVLIHPQSIVHSFVNLRDGTSLAHVGSPDMRIPIQYALLGRQESPYPTLDLSACGPLTFGSPDGEKFPCLALAYRAAEMGGSAPAVLSAADEEAVHIFLEGKAPFTGIPRMVEAVLEKHTPVPSPCLDEVLAADAWAREQVRSEARKCRR